MIRNEFSCKYQRILTQPDCPYGKSEYVIPWDITRRGIKFGIKFTPSMELKLEKIRNKEVHRKGGPNMTCKVAITQNMNWYFNLVATGTHLVTQGSMRENDRFGGNTMVRTFPNEKLNFRRYF